MPIFFKAEVSRLAGAVFPAYMPDLADYLPGIQPGHALG